MSSNPQTGARRGIGPEDAGSRPRNPQVVGNELVRGEGLGSRLVGGFSSKEFASTRQALSNRRPLRNKSSESAN
jgi:hypothetical protein